MNVIRMDNVGMVVEDLEASIEFFTALGLTLEGRMRIDDEWAGSANSVLRLSMKSSTTVTFTGSATSEVSKVFSLGWPNQLDSRRPERTL